MVSQAPQTLPRIGLVIPTFNEPELLERCVDSAYPLSGAELKPIVVNAGDPLPEHVAAKVEEVNVPSDHFWTACIDVGMRVAKERGYEYVCLTNADTEFFPGTIDNLLAESVKRERTVVCSPGYVREKDGTVNLLYSHDISMRFWLHNYLQRAWKTPDEAPSEPYEVTMIGGQGVLIPMALLGEAWVDPQRFPHNRGDMDLWLSMRKKGVKLVMVPKAGIVNNRPLSTSGMTGWQQMKKLKFLFFNPIAKDSWHCIWNIRRKHLGLALAIPSAFIYTPLIWVWRIVRMFFRPA